MLKSSIFYKTIILFSILIVGYTLTITTLALSKMATEIRILEEKNAKEVLSKAVLVNKISYRNLESFKKKRLQGRKKELKNITTIAFSILEEYHYLHKKGKISEETAKKNAFLKISKLRYNKGDYFFILDDKYTLVSHPNKTIEGQNHFNLQDIKGSYFSRKMVDNTREKGEAFTRYWWAKITGKPFEKLAYTRTFKPWNIYLGTGVYIGDIRQEITKRGDELFNQLKEIMKTTTIGKSGYVFVFDENGKFIIHPNHDLVDTQLPKSLFRKFVQASKTKKTTAYKWNKLEDKKNYVYDKLAWIAHLSKQNWYIGASIYKEDLNISLTKFNHAIMTLSAVMSFIFLFISFFLLKKLLTPISNLSKVVKRVTKGEYKARAEVETTDEIGQLSCDFNQMIEQIEENRKKENQLVEQSRLAQMGEMMSMVAHQWRQPLGAISSAIMGIQIKLKTGKYDFEKKYNREEFLQYLDKKHTRVNGYVQFLSSTIDDFRDFFKPEIDKKLVSLTTPIEKALQIVEVSLINKKISLKLDFKSKDEVLIHQNEIMQVVLNIIKNSEDNFIENDTSNPKIEIKTKKEKDNYTISISDNGGGIPKDILPKIFEPYFSTKLEKNGTGLGLYMSKIIVEKHNGGTLHVNNTKDGVCFKIVL